MNNIIHKANIHQIKHTGTKVLHYYVYGNFSTNNLLMKRTTLIILCIYMISCNKGIWLSQNVYRPIHPKFNIKKEPFRSNDLINNDNLYISTKKFINYDGNIIIRYIGFYKDGRMIVDNTWQNQMDVTLNNRNSFKTASSIGYYTTIGNKINMQFFVQGDGGQYQTSIGLIKKDTIILTDRYNFLFHKVMRYDTLVKSSYLLR